MAHEHYRQTDDRQTTDRGPMTYSEREREFTFDKNGENFNSVQEIEEFLSIAGLWGW